MSYQPNPDDLFYDEESQAFRDPESGNLYRDDEGKEPITEGYED